MSAPGRHLHLVFFGLSLTSSWGNGHATTYRGLLAGLRRRGHEIDFFERDADWYAAHRDLPAPPQARLHLYRDWAAERASALDQARSADAVIVGSYFPDAVPLLQALWAGSHPPVCFYDIDTPVTLEALTRGQCAYLRPELIPEFDLYLSFTGGAVLQELQSRWHARRTAPLYCACDAAEYQPVHPRPRAPAALSFLGTYAPDRQAKLERLLLEPARRLPKVQFRVAGSMYPQTAHWPSNVQYTSHLAPAAHPRFYASARFTLNLTRQAMVEAGYSPSIRLFEAAACGTAIITDPWPGLADFFQPDQEILIADSSEQMLALLLRGDDQQAEALGSAARQRLLSQHTGEHRAIELESHLLALCAPQLSSVSD